MTGVAERSGPAWLRFLLPGFSQLRAGRWGAGGLSVLGWTVGCATLLLRWDRVSALERYGLQEWTALVTLLLSLAGPLAWSWVDGRRRPSAERGRWGSAARTFGRHRLAVVGGVVVVGASLVAFLAPFIAPFDPMAQGDLITGRFGGLSSLHPFGTDQVGRDVLSRLMFGARVSLSIGLASVALSVSLGTVLGAVSGYVGGWFDAVIMRLVDVGLAFPRIVLLISVVAFFDPSWSLVVLVLALTQWPSMTRIVRGEVLALREREFVQAAKVLGFSNRRVLFGHILPNAWAPIIVAATLAVGNAIVLEAGLGFLGLGVPASAPSWGGMVADGRTYLLNAWWLSTFPALAIVIVVVSINVVGDGLRDALDPRMRGLVRE